MNLYFSYGIEINQTKMRNICKNASIYGIGKCFGYRFSINSIGGTTIIPSDNTSVYGVLWEIPNSEMEFLEVLNTTSKHKIAVSIERINPAQNERTPKYLNKHIDNNFVEAFTYKDVKTTYGSPNKSDIETILAVLKNNYVPNDYIQEIGFWLS